MGDPSGFRRERIEKLLHELEYEIVRGMMEGDIEEEFGFRFMVPVSKKIPDGIVRCEFRSRPFHRNFFSPDEMRIKVINGGRP